MRVLSLLLVVLVAACGPAAVSTTTVGTTTSTSTTTTSTVATTTTSGPESSTTTVAAVEGVPEEALALIGAEMPEVPDFSDGFDAEVWFESYAAWNRWAFANPEEGLASLDQWVVPGSEYYVALEEQLGLALEEGYRLVGTDDVELVDVEVGDELLDEGVAVLNVVTEVTGTGWTLQDGRVIGQDNLSGQRRSLIGLNGSEGVWRVTSWE